MNPDFIDATGLIVAAWAHQADNVDDLCRAIREVHSTLLTCFGQPPQDRKSVVHSHLLLPDSKDFVTCRVCGEQFVLIKRHLRTRHSLTPGQYTALHPGAPLIASGYSNVRSDIAQKSGLGLARAVSKPENDEDDLVPFE